MFCGVKQRISIATLAALLPTVACRTTTNTSGAFTRDSVLARARDEYPGVSLPSDAPVPGVDEQRDICFRSAGGHVLALDVFIPSGPGPYPAVVVVHGGGWKSGDRAMERPFARALASRGFVAVPVSYRLGPAGRFPGALIDIKAAVRWLRANAARFRIAPERVGAVGSSAGGQLVALAGASNGETRYDDSGPAGCSGEVNSVASTDLNAVVDIDGLADFADPALIVHETRAPGGPTLFLGGSFAERPEVWREASALNHIGPHSAPTLFINSTAAAPLLPGRPQMRERMRALGIDAEVQVVLGTPHPFWLLNPWFSPTAQAAAVFLHRHLDAVPSAPPLVPAPKSYRVFRSW